MTLHEKIQRFIRRNPISVPRVPLSEIETSCRTYEELGQWDSVYRIATTLVSQGFGEPKDVSKTVDGLIVLLWIRNQQFYGPNGFDEPAMRQLLIRNESLLDNLRNRDINSFGNQNYDDETVERMFIELLHPLRKDRKRSPVSVAKALHLLAPDFFPLWDAAIATNWTCPFGSQSRIGYVVFCHRMKEFAEPLVEEMTAPSSPWLSKKTLVKRIDEYNYVNRSNTMWPRASAHQLLTVTSRLAEAHFIPSARNSGASSKPRYFLIVILIQTPAPVVLRGEIRAKHFFVRHISALSAGTFASSSSTALRCETPARALQALPLAPIP